MLESYKQQVVDFFDRRTTYDAEGDSHPKEAKRLLEFVSVEPGQTILDLATGTGLIAIAAAKKVAPNGSVIGVDISSGMLQQARSKIVTEGIDNLELIEADVEAMQSGLARQSVGRVPRLEGISEGVSFRTVEGGGLPHKQHSLRRRQSPFGTLAHCAVQEAIDFDAEQFDVIFCCSALVYISDLQGILNKCYSWLKPKGCFAFTTPDKKSHLAELKVKVCQDLFGIDLPHIIRPLWTPKKCRDLLQQSGFKDIVIERYLYSRTKIGDNYESTRLEREFYPRGNPLSKLSETQRKLLQIEYAKAVTQLIAEQGVWQSANNLYVKACK